MGEEIKLDAEPLAPPTLAEVQGWRDFGVDDIEGNAVAKVSGCFVDTESGRPAWLLAKLGRFSGEIAIPMHDCAAVAGTVWVPYHRDILKEAPIVDPSRPLNREQELLICEYFGLGENHGRAAEVKDRPAGTITSQAPQG